MQIRAAATTEVDHLAQLWHDAWHETHAPLLPGELTRLRTLDSFRERLQSALPTIRVVGPPGAPVGFCITRGEELYQLFVSPESRGSGAAALLIGDAEARLAERDVETAWLACAVGNNRAARFYEKQGWRLAGTVVNAADTASGPFPLEVWRYEKSLARASAGT
jgi:ribosomal protein S18 acetylase RimI-like enzyme